MKKLTTEELKEVLRLHRLWLEGSPKGRRADFTDADLSNADLSNADLSCADLTRADLTCARLARANLTEVDLTGACLIGADLTGVNLTDAILVHVDLSEAVRYCGNFAEVTQRVHALAVANGWWGAEPNIPEKLALVHSELSEALECYRNNEMTTTISASYDKPEGFGVELADAVIRILDLCGYLGIDLGVEIERKHNYNMTRPYRHGGKRA